MGSGSGSEELEEEEEDEDEEDEVEEVSGSSGEEEETGVESVEMGVDCEGLEEDESPPLVSQAVSSAVETRAQARILILLLKVFISLYSFPILVRFYI